MSRSDRDGHAISYKVLEPGTPVSSCDGRPVGTVREVLDNVAENIFDGIVIDTPEGQRFIDAPEIDHIAEHRVTLTLDHKAAAALPEHDAAGGPTYHANARGGRLSRLFGSGWKRD